MAEYIKREEAMNVKEKLIEILRKPIFPHELVDPTEAVADYLLDNGVTVQECGQWIYDFNLAGSNFYRCSVCDRQETLLEKEDIYENCPFCHCGAKMIPQPPKGE